MKNPKQLEHERKQRERLYAKLTGASPKRDSQIRAKMARAAERELKNGGK